VLGPKDQPAKDTGTHTAPPHTPDAQATGPSPGGDQKAAAAENKPKPSGNLIRPKLGEYFYTYTFSPDTRVFSRNDQVDSRVFQYVESSPGALRYPSIHASGSEKMALLATKEELENYTLHVRWKWGRESFGARADKQKHASVLLHCTGPDGGASGVIPQSVAVQMHEGAVGSINLMGPEGVIHCKGQARRDPKTGHFVHDPDAPTISLAAPGTRMPKDKDEEASKNPDAGAKGWDGIIYHRGFDEAKSSEGTPPNRWNHLRIVCDQGSITVYFNNAKVNQITNCNQTRGRIGFTFNRADWYISRIEVALKGAESGGK
jgi:hypothetical protein